MSKYWKCNNCENINNIGFFSPTRQKQKCVKCEQPREAEKPVQATLDDKLETLLHAIGTNQVVLAELARKLLEIEEQVKNEDDLPRGEILDKPIPHEEIDKKKKGKK